MRGALVTILLVCAVHVAHGQNALTINEVRTDRATLHAIGVQVLIAGDANRNAEIRVRYRPAGAQEYREALPLFRVLPETVTGRMVPEQLAGTIFDVAPGGSYEIELEAIDPDGGGETRMLTATTRSWPADPATPHVVEVATATELRGALQDAAAGDVIELADGTYAGAFSITASGTAEQPIVIRGASRDGTVIDGEDCAGCNILEVYGSYIHVERLTLAHGTRALRFLGTGTTANAALGLRIEDIQHGIGAGVDQTDFTLCDNIVHGRLQWPLIYSDDGAAHADDQGIRVDGSGHVVCHNDISGFGDPMINFAEGGRAYDFYGNDIHEIYADGTELDRGEGNVRLWGNRWTNVYTAISIQPAYGGPLYVLRNQILNVADEQIKLKSVGGTVEPSGVLIYHNTFVSPDIALNLQTPITQHNFAIANNLFVAPAQIAGRTVEWTAAIDRGEFDGNGYFPDAGYWFGTVGTARTFATLADAQAAGIETRGRVLTAPIFAGDVTAPATYTEVLAPADLVLAATSNAIDAAIELPGINARHVGAGADLGARELGCPAPHYGPRPAGSELVTNLVDCSADDVPPGGGDAGTTGEPPGSQGSGGGCCQAPRDARGTLVLVAAVAFGAFGRRRHRRGDC